MEEIVLSVLFLIAGFVALLLDHFSFAMWSAGGAFILFLLVKQIKGRKREKPRSEKTEKAKEEKPQVAWTTGLFR